MNDFETTFLPSSVTSAAITETKGTVGSSVKTTVLPVVTQPPAPDPFVDPIFAVGSLPGTAAADGARTAKATRTSSAENFDVLVMARSYQPARRLSLETETDLPRSAVTLALPLTVTLAPKVTSPSTLSESQPISDGGPCGNRASKSLSSLK